MSIILFFFQSSSNCNFCLGNLSLGGIIVLAGLAGFLICYLLNKNPTADLDDSLISNEQALQMIENLNISDTKAAKSGHIELGVMLSYIDSMKSKCKAAGKPMTGLEYFFAQYGPAEHMPNGGQKTILFYPTYGETLDEKTVHIPFDPESSAASVKEMNDDRNTRLDGNQKKIINPNWSTTRNVLNRTHMSPPNPPLTL